MEMILLTILCIILFGVTGFLGFRFYQTQQELVKLKATVEEYTQALAEGQKAVDLALKYEEFYSSTVGDIGEIVDTFNNLIGRRQMLSDDPDVQNLVRLLAIAHDTLLGYMNAKLPTESGTTSTDNPTKQQ